MFDFLEKLHKKPENKRRIFATSVSLGVTLVIFLVWLSVILPTSVHKEVTSGENSGWSRGIKTPFEAVKKNTAQAFSALKGQLDSIKESIKINPDVYNAESTTSESFSSTN